MSLLGKIEIITDEGMDGILDLRKLKKMLNDGEKLISVIPIETRGKGDYDMVAGVTASRILVCDADYKHSVSLEFDLTTCEVKYWETPKRHPRILIGNENYKVDNKNLTKDFVNKCNELKNSF